MKEKKKILVGQSIGSLVGLSFLADPASSELGEFDDVFLNSPFGFKPSRHLPVLSGFLKYLGEQFRGGQEVEFRLPGDAQNDDQFPDLEELLTWAVMPRIYNGQTTKDKLDQAIALHPNTSFWLSQGTKEFDHSPESDEKILSVDADSTQLTYFSFKGHGHELFNNPTVQAELVANILRRGENDVSDVFMEWYTRRYDKASEFPFEKEELLERMWGLRMIKKATEKILQ